MERDSTRQALQTHQFSRRRGWLRGWGKRLQLAAMQHSLMLDGTEEKQLLIKLCLNDALVLNPLPWFIG